MKAMQYLLFEGKLQEASQPFAGIENRSLRYGDGFFESISIKQHRTLLLNEHLVRIVYAVDVLRMQLPPEWSEDYLSQQISRLLSANGEPVNARCRLLFWRKGEGTYLPNSNETGWVLSMHASNSNRFELGMIEKCAVYNEVLKPINRFASFKTTNALLYVMASVFMKQQDLGECILLNDRNEVCEGSTTNIWLVKNGRVLTPNNESGCVQGVMRSHLLKVLPDFFEVEVQCLSPDDVLEADEVFFTNAGRIQSVHMIGNRVYAKKIATRCVAILNESLSL